MIELETMSTAKLAVVVLVSMTGACGGSSVTNYNCGAGTVLVEGSCVVADGGPERDSAEPAADSSRVESDVPSETDSIMVDTAATEIGVDPCAPGESINCGGACSNHLDTCGRMRCLFPTGAPVVIDSYGKLPLRFRTAKPDLINQRCPSHCDRYEQVYGYRVDLDLPSKKFGFIVTVDPPWKIHHTFTEACASPAYRTSCDAIPQTEPTHVFVVTTDGDAPPSDVVIREATKDEVCP